MAVFTMLWDEYFDYDKWLQAFENTGVDMDFYNLRKRELDESSHGFHQLWRDKIFPYKRMEECNGRECNPELPCKMFRLWGSKLRRRCLL